MYDTRNSCECRKRVSSLLSRGRWFNPSSDESLPCLRSWQRVVLILLAVKRQGRGFDPRTGYSSGVGNSLVAEWGISNPLTQVQSLITEVKDLITSQALPC